MRVVITDPVSFLGAVGVHGLVLGVVFHRVSAFDVIANFVISHESGLARVFALRTGS